jgi:subtilase family serine protease
MHRRRFALFTAACMAALVLASVPAVAGHQVLSGHVPQAVAQSQVEAALPASTRLNLAIGLPLRNQEKLEALLAQLSDPASPNFRHYLTPAQFAAQFGPTEADYQALIKFVNEKGLVVTATHPNRMLLDVSGTVPEVENALQVKMMSYIHPARGRFFAPDREPSLDLDVQVLSIGGLNNFVLPQPMGLKAMSIGQAKPLVTGSGPYGYFIGKDFRAAYAPVVTLTGSGQVVGLLEFDGFYAGDVTKNAAAAGVAAVPTQTVLLDGYNGAPGSGNIEVILDIMMASYMAPGLSKVLVYEGYYPDDVLNRMATDNQAQQLSSSWGFPIDATTE